MRRGREVALALMLATAPATVGCEDEGAEDAEAAARPASPAKTNRTEPKRPRPYGPDGRLLPSDESIAGLRLPMGLELVRKEERRHVYRTSVPLAKVQEYFGPLLLTGEVDLVGQGAIYRSAIPKGVKGAAVKLDVSIVPASSGTRVEIVEIRPPPTNPPSLTEVKRWAKEKQWE